MDMDNSSLQSVTLSVYAAMEGSKHAQFAVFLLLYVLTVALNSQLIAVVCLHKGLQLPMNVFTCVLSANEIYGSSALLPATMSLLLSRTYDVSVRWCKAQVYFLHTYVFSEFCILAVMGYDRYVAICYPLHYRTIMCGSRVGKLAALACVYPLTVFACFYSITLRLKLCGRVVPKMYCVNMELVRNSCSRAAHVSIAGLVLIFFSVVPQLLMVLFSYLQIFRVCRRLSGQSQAKALRTCVPHLLSLANFTVACMFEIVQSRLDMRHVPLEARVFMSLYFILLPPLVNPLLYGLGTRVVRVHVRRMFVRREDPEAKEAQAEVVA